MCAASGLALFYYNHGVHPAFHSDASQAARRWSTAPLSQPTAMFSPAQSMADTGLGARKKATAGFVSPLSSAPSWTTTSSPSALTRKRPTRCSGPAVFEKANWSPAASCLLAPVDTSQTLIEPSSLALTSVAPSRNSTCVTVRLQRFAGNCEHDSACGLNLEERADSSVPRSRYFDRCISNGRSKVTGEVSPSDPMPWAQRPYAGHGRPISYPKSSKLVLPIPPVTLFSLAKNDGAKAASSTDLRRLPKITQGRRLAEDDTCDLLRSSSMGLSMGQDKMNCQLR